MKYRHEIDGLRAIAVITVILFHAGINSFKGGYIGVDVFFVISGYLITSIIIREQKENRFNIFSFYERRVRRIFPALFSFLFFTSIASIVFFDPELLKKFANGLLSTIFFSSNIYFWRTSGYFQTDSEIDPLIHMWTLSVEEQFYLFFPVIMIFIYRHLKQKAVLVIIILFLISLIASDWSSSRFTQANFYLLPTRGWEILLGSICSFINLDRINSKTVLNDLLSLLGLLMILISVIYFDDKTPYPSFYSVIPTFGTALLIVFSYKSIFIKQLLSIKLLVRIGLISYSLYLIHQPILAFLRFNLGFNLSILMKLFAIIFSVILAYISWVYVETPFRNKDIIKSKNIIRYSIKGIFTFVIIFTALSFSNGLEKLKLSLYNKEELSRYNMINEATGYDMNNNMIQGECNFWFNSISELEQFNFDDCFKKFGQANLIIGDSHAMNLYNIFSKTNKFKFLIGYSKGGFRFYEKTNSKEFDELKNLIISKKKYLNKLIYHQSGQKSLFKDNRKFLFSESIIDENRISKTLSFLKNFSDLSIETFWLGPHVEYNYTPIINIKKDIPLNNKYRYKIQEVDKYFSSISFERYNVNYLQFEDFYYIPEKGFIEKCFIWRDKDHFSRCGEQIISKNAYFFNF